MRIRGEGGVILPWLQRIERIANLLRLPLSSRNVVVRIALVNRLRRTLSFELGRWRQGRLFSSLLLGNWRRF